jgi:FAD/FMN-containing dehydrogenase
LLFLGAQMKRISCLFLLIFSFNSLASLSDQASYDEAIKEVNNYLDYNARYLSCPGTKLVVTCGNLICEPHENETIENCPADCLKNVTVRSYNNITLCDDYISSQVPQTTLEVQDLVKKAKSLKTQIKPIGASHSATEIMCASGMVVPMSQLNKVIGISEIDGQKVVEAESGITVFELSKWLDQKGFALDGLPHMGFRDVTIGGAMATGSHGSSPNLHGVISNIVEAIEFVDGNGERQYLERKTANQDTFKALTANLGLLGIVTKIKFRIQKAFNLAVKVSYHKDSEIMQGGLLNTVKGCDYGQLNWFPGIEKFMKTCGKKTSKAAHKGADNELLKPKIPSFIVKPFKKILQLGACHNSLMGLVERVRWWQFKLQPPMVIENKKGKKKNKHFVVGPAYRMVSSHLTDDQDGFFQMDWEIAVPASKAEQAMEAIKAHTQKWKTKLPLVGVFIRFAPSESASLMAHTVSDGKDWKEGETAVFFEMPVYVPVGFSKEEFKIYEKQYVEFASMLINDFSGRPHWGKNRMWSFDLAMQNNRYGSNLVKFKKVRAKLDPDGIFENWFAETLGL